MRVESKITMIICLSLDSDWAHPEITTFALELLEREGVPFTFFATEDQSIFSSSLSEIAWHPNFERLNAYDELKMFQNLFPEAKGLRPHRLSMPGDCLDAIQSSGIQWVSSHFDPDSKKIKSWKGVLPDIPIFWGDGLYLKFGAQPGLDKLEFEETDIVVINFHPIHLFLNTSSMSHYQFAKIGYDNPCYLRNCINNEELGVRNILEYILEFSSNLKFLTITDALDYLSK